MIKITDEMRDLLQKYSEGFVSEDTATKRIIELHEANKPNPTPVGYIYKHRLAQMLSSDVDNDCNFFPIKNDITAAIFNKNSDKYIALYTTKPVQETLSAERVSEILFEVRKGKMLFWDFAREIEKAHGIGI